jgi:hypothetical protein
MKRTWKLGKYSRRILYHNLVNVLRCFHSQVLTIWAQIEADGAALVLVKHFEHRVLVVWLQSLERIAKEWNSRLICKLRELHKHVRHRLRRCLFIKKEG